MVKAGQCYTSRRAKRVGVVVGLARGPGGSAPGKREVGQRAHRLKW